MEKQSGMATKKSIFVLGLQGYVWAQYYKKLKGVLVCLLASIETALLSGSAKDS